MTKTTKAMTSINFKHDKLVDSGCDHHLIGDDIKFINFR